MGWGDTSEAPSGGTTTTPVATTTQTTTLRATTPRVLLVSLPPKRRQWKRKRPHFRKPTVPIFPKKFGKLPILGETLEGSGEGEADRKEGAETGSGEDDAGLLFQPEWPEVTYFTTDMKQAGMSVGNLRVLNK